MWSLENHAVESQAQHTENNVNGFVQAFPTIIYKHTGQGSCYIKTYTEE
jgi:hypothetical protein